MAALHRVYLIPGMFGFGKLAGYDYFEHVERELALRLDRSGVPFRIEVVPTPPTASIRRRARVVAEAVHRASGGDDGPIHLLGHSTGGLDARLLASPTVDIGVTPAELAWRKRLHTVVTINTPHFGTPLAQFFATVSGTRLLYALSLLTVTTLKLGGPPMTVFSTLVAAIGGLDEALGIDVHLLDRATELLLRFVGDRNRDEVRTWLDGIRVDQGGIIQISPEAMDLFNAATENCDGVRYGCLASAAPAPTPMRFASRVRSPYAAFSAAIYTTLYTVAARVHEGYPYATPDTDAARMIEIATGKPPDPRLSDGIVPSLSMLWGKLLWFGRGDHLDVVGHFHDDARPTLHTDWLSCGASFDRPRFAAEMDAVARFLLEDPDARPDVPANETEVE